MITRKTFSDELEKKYGVVKFEDKERTARLITINQIPNIAILAGYKFAEGEKYDSIKDRECEGISDKDPLKGVYVTGTTDLKEYMKLNGFKEWVEEQLNQNEMNLKLKDNRIEVYTHISDDTTSLDQIYESITAVSLADEELREVAEDVSARIAALQASESYDNARMRVQAPAH